MSSSRQRSTRRDFLRQTGGLVAGMSLAGAWPALPPEAYAVQQPNGANERIRIGHIGVGNQGMPNLRAHLRNTVAVCDVDSTRLAAARAAVERANGGTCAHYADYRRLLDNRDVDALVI